MSDYSNNPGFDPGAPQSHQQHPHGQPQPAQPHQAPNQPPYPQGAAPYNQYAPGQQPMPQQFAPQNGAPLGYNNPTEPPFPPQQPPYTFGPQRKKGIGAGGIIAIVAGVMLVVGVGVYFGYRYLTDKARDYTKQLADWAPGNTGYEDAAVEETEAVMEVPVVDAVEVVAEEDFAWLAQRRVEYADIASMSKADRRILRNAIYARHGYIFKSDDLREYFSQFSWYSPRYTDVSSQLSQLERDNVMFIKSYE